MSRFLHGVGKPIKVWAILTVLVILCRVGTCQKPSFNNAPVIGVMTMPCQFGEIEEDGRFHPFDSKTMNPEDHFYYGLFNSYKTYLEIAGAKVVPIIHDTPREKLLPLLGKLNGVLFTGGGLDLVDRQTKEYHVYTKTSQIIFDYALNQTDMGDYFPLIGI